MPGRPVSLCIKLNCLEWHKNLLRNESVLHNTRHPNYMKRKEYHVDVGLLCCNTICMFRRNIVPQRVCFFKTLLSASPYGVTMQKINILTALRTSYLFKEHLHSMYLLLQNEFLLLLALFNNISSFILKSLFSELRPNDTLDTTSTILCYIVCLQLFLMSCNVLFQAGISSGYQEKPCLDPSDPECPSTAPNKLSQQVGVNTIILPARACTYVAYPFLKLRVLQKWLWSRSESSVTNH